MSFVNRFLPKIIQEQGYTDAMKSINNLKMPYRN